MSYDRVEYLIKKYLQENISAIELRELMEAFPKDEYAGLFQNAIDKAFQEQPIFTAAATEIQAKQLFDKIRKKAMSSGYVTKRGHVSRMRILARVAAAVIALLMGAFWILRESHPINKTELAQQKTFPNIPVEAPPGENKAILTLADGKVILLDSNSVGEVSKQGAAAVHIKKDGEIVYNQEKDNVSHHVAMNVLSIPKSGQYKLQLADGTTIWLNSSSVLRYPSTFSGNSREVELTGEAYFEVASNKEKPFIVKLKNDAKVEVLGTEFNINAYDNEAELRTTLLQGSVKISIGNNQQMLMPGQQSRIDKTGKLSMVADVDTEAVLAWKNGQFMFKSTDIKRLMRQLERWYDIEIEFKGADLDDRFSGTVPKSANLSTVLKILELSEVRFRLEGKKLVVISAGRE